MIYTYDEYHGNTTSDGNQSGDDSQSGGDTSGTPQQNNTTPVIPDLKTEDDKEAEAAAAATGFVGAKTRLSVGTTFTDYGSGITYRVTKQASYRTLGEVEMVG
ncbi:hypothetical protein [Butyrivibrio sp. AC2005]|uniref:hypothetical protein n=1 Tax=Butyrivibrio sp. AC2005 TaxID=1280672 RepID=UPI0004074191|nr:hypothetical protein [Butyrivibrio sp. AC2005]